MSWTPVLGALSFAWDLSRLSKASDEALTDHVVVAIGNPALRQTWQQVLEQVGSPLGVVLHPRAIVSATAQLGPGSVVLAGAVVNANASLHQGILVNSGALGGMRYVMRQKFWSWGDDYRIRDASENEVYLVNGKVFSWGDKLSFQDPSGHELAFIRQKLLNWGPTYDIEKDGRVVAEVRKHLFTLFRCRFTVDVPGPDDLEASGDLLDREYTFRRHGRVVAEVSKRWFSWTDTYGVDIADGEDVVVILASAVIIDLVCHDHQGQQQ